MLRRSAGRAAVLRGAAFAVVVAAAVYADGRRATSPHVLVIVVDALRADHLEAYGYGRETAPSIARLAADGARFTDAYAQGPSTVPSHSSLFTGRYPFQHGSYDVLHPLRDEELTMAEFFQASGYRTFAVASSVRFHPMSGFAQGFETYEVVRTPTKAGLGATVTRKALEIITAHDRRPFFGFLHYLGPHQPYAPPAPFRTMWHPGLPQPRPEDTGAFLAAHQGPEHALDDETLAYLEGLYDGEITYVDHEIGGLLRGLVYAGLARDTIVVLTSDHGEQFKEHGGLSHGGALHEELLRVPLIVSWPRRIAPRTVLSQVAQAVDVFPTLASLAGLKPPPGLAGRDLGAALLGERPPAATDAVVLAQGTPTSWALIATIDGRRLKYESRAGAPVLYDLSSDPRGIRDVLPEFPAEAERMRELAGAMGVDGGQLAPTIGDVPESVREQLRALGYVEEAGPAAQGH